MLKAIRLELWQQMPNYRKPSSFLIKESYPLPPYSSVIGMIHAACGMTEYHPMDISIQGNYASETADLATMYNFGISYDPARHQKKVQNEQGGYDGINIGPKYCQLLTDVSLIIHIAPKQEEDFERILAGLLHPKSYLSLGRHEDIVRIDTVSTTELTPCDMDNETVYFQCRSGYDAYVPITPEMRDESLVGTGYKIPKKFSIHNGFRQWDEVVPVMHLSPLHSNTESILNGSNVFYDADAQTLVFFA